MRVLITGGRGFIGSRLAAKLGLMGHAVKILDAADGRSINNPDDVAEAVKGTDVVYHLAAELDENSPTLEKTNVEGTKKLLEACAKARLQRFIFLSTAGVMGNIAKKADESAPIQPVTSYERSKAEAEKLVLNYQEVLPVVVVRSALVYGPNKYWTQILRMIENGFPLIGGGKNCFQMIYVDDLVDALAFLLKRGEAGEVYIAAENDAHLLKEVYAEAAAQLGIKKKPKTISPLTAKMVALVYSLGARLSSRENVLTGAHIARLMRERNYSTEKINSLGWKAKYSLSEGMKQTISALNAQKAL